MKIALALLLLFTTTGFAKGEVGMPAFCSLGSVGGIVSQNAGAARLANVAEQPVGALMSISQVRRDGLGPIGQMVISGIMTTRPFAKTADITVAIVPMMDGTYDIRALWVTKQPDRNPDEVWVQVQLFGVGESCL
jgi:hypothetical protein